LLEPDCDVVGAVADGRALLAWIPMQKKRANIQTIRINKRALLNVSF
jgi:hypothetical protein